MTPEVDTSRPFPVVLLSLPIHERILLALKPGPKSIHDLASAVGVSVDLYAQRLSLWRRLDAMRRKKQIRKLGARQFTRWALASYEGQPPAMRHRWDR